MTASHPSKYDWGIAYEVFYISERKENILQQGGLFKSSMHCSKSTQDWFFLCADWNDFFKIIIPVAGLSQPSLPSPPRFFFITLYRHKF